MVIFNSYVKLPEGIDIQWHQDLPQPRVNVPAEAVQCPAIWRAILPSMLRPATASFTVRPA